MGDIVPAGKTSFVRVGEHELAATGKKLATLSDQALQVLANGLLVMMKNKNRLCQDSCQAEY